MFADANNLIPLPRDPSPSANGHFQGPALPQGHNDQAGDKVPVQGTAAATGVVSQLAISVTRVRGGRIWTDGVNAHVQVPGHGAFQPALLDAIRAAGLEAEIFTFNETAGIRD